MERLVKKKHWIFLVVVALWVLWGQLIFIADNLTNIDNRFISTSLIVIATAFMISVGILRIFDFEKTEVMVLNLLILLLITASIMVFLIFDNRIGTSYFILQIIITGITWRVLRKKKAPPIDKSSQSE